MPTKMLLDGNHAAAWSARLARVQVIPVYPITPQTECASQLSEFVQSGQMPWASYVTPEGEHAVMGILLGASAAGARAFSASSAQGVVFMEENIWIGAGLRLPVVLAIVNRSIAHPGRSNAPDQNDSLLQRDAGWLQVYCEDAQEVLDMGIQLFKICEDERVYLPGILAYDGFLVSHCAMPVELPEPEEVDKFLPPYHHKYISLDHERHDFHGTNVRPTWSETFTEQIYQMHRAMENAKTVIREVNEDYGKMFGRTYGNGLIEKYRCNDAEAVLVTMGAITGTARSVIDEMRGEGQHIGLVKLRFFRPFPTEEFRALAENVKVIGFADKNRSPGSPGGGVGTIELARALYPLEKRPLLMGFFVGLAGRDVMPRDIRFMAEKVLEAAETGKTKKETYWVQLRGEPED